MRSLKKGIAYFVGLISGLLPASGLPAAEQNMKNAGSVPSNQSQGAKFAKDELISALKNLSISARSIRVVSAMCYSVELIGGDIAHFCPLCKRTVSYKRQSNEGMLVGMLPYIQRSFSNLPYKFSIDSSSLCPACGKGKPKSLTIHIACLECGKDIPLDVKNGQDINMLQWLYLKPPFTELDGNNLNIPQDITAKEDAIRKGIGYIRDHVFCPLHRGMALDDPHVQK